MVLATADLKAGCFCRQPGLSSVAMNWCEFCADLAVDRDSVLRGCSGGGSLFFGGEKMHFGSIMCLAAAVVAGPQVAVAADPLPPELRGAADMRSQVEAVVGSATSGRGLGVGMAPAATPEEEMARRRKLINGAHRDFVGAVAAQRAPVGMEGVRASQGSESEVAGRSTIPGSRRGKLQRVIPERVSTGRCVQFNPRDARPAARDRHRGAGYRPGGRGAGQRADQGQQELALQRRGTFCRQSPDRRADGVAGDESVGSAPMSGAVLLHAAARSSGRPAACARAWGRFPTRVRRSGGASPVRLFHRGMRPAMPARPGRRRSSRSGANTNSIRFRRRSR